jgi:hypothetical protein
MVTVQAQQPEGAVWLTSQKIKLATKEASKKCVDENYSIKGTGT